MKINLTRRQQEILDYLREQDFDPPPTLDELCRALGLSSRGSLHKHISALVEAGLVEPMDGKHRGVVLREAETTADADRLPFLGYIAAGRPIEAIPSPRPSRCPPPCAPAGPAMCWRCAATP
jgi:repressor LexA